jgi:hypothetical protein
LALTVVNAAALGAEPVPVSIGGAVEVELATGETFDGDKSSGLSLATVEIGFEAVVNDWTHAHVLLLHEDEEPDTWEVDEGVITLSNGDKQPYYLSIGRMFVPFGRFGTALVSDPLTLELGETRETALQIGYDATDLSAAIYVFNGDTIEAGEDDNLQQFGLSLDYNQAWQSSMLSLGLSYISNIADAEGLAEALPSPAVDSFVAGAGIFASYEHGPLRVMLEYVGALADFHATELGFAGAGASPSAYKLELNYGFEWSGREVTAAIAYQGTEEALALELPEQRLSVGLATELFENTLLGAELLRDGDYSSNDGGTGNNVNSLIVRLAVEF